LGNKRNRLRALPDEGRARSLTPIEGFEDLPDRLLDIKEVAYWLNTTERHIRRLVEKKKIPNLKVGDKLRFDPVAIRLWMNENRRDAT
jgi:excisionase family DNA binding protein